MRVPYFRVNVPLMIDALTHLRNTTHGEDTAGRNLADLAIEHLQWVGRNNERDKAVFTLGELVLERAKETPHELVIIHPDRDRELFDALTADRAP